MATARSFIAGTTTAVAPVAAVPTTAAHFALWNGEQTGGKSYVITSVSMTDIVSAGAALVLQILVNNSTGPIPVLSGTVAQGPRALDGVFGGSKAQACSAVTIGNSGIWHPVGASVNAGAATATIAMGAYQNVRGIYTVPPGGLFALAVLCSAAGAATCSLFVTWEEA